MENSRLEEKNLYNIYIRPLDLLLTNLFVIICFIIFFKPFWYELVYAYLVDAISLVIIQKVGLYLFLRKHQNYNLILPKINSEGLDCLGNSEKLKFVEELFAYPHNRSVQIYVLSFIKVFFGGFIIVHLWQHDPSESILLRWAIFWVIELLGIQYFASCSFIELQSSVYEIIKYLQNRESWNGVLSKINPVKRGFYHGTFESFSLISIAIFVIGLISLYLYGNESLKLKDFIMTLVILFSGVVFVSRTYYSFRSHFFRSFNEIYSHFQNFSPENLKFVPFHVIPDLTKFEVAYNNLIENLILREKALSKWVAYETEQGQVRLLGEITGLVAHDLSGPLNAINFCVDELKEKIDKKDLRFLEHLDLNTRRINELVDSLKAQIKNPYKNISESSLFEVYKYTMKVLNTQFRSKGLDRINIQFDQNLENISIQMSRINSGHILYNFFKNSIENLLDNNIENPSIEMKLKERFNGQVVVSFIDNGTGLSKESFDEMTSLDPLATFADKSGLGLRLTRRLIENNGGKIVFVEKDEKKGTHYDFYFNEKT